MDNNISFKDLIMPAKYKKIDGLLKDPICKDFLEILKEAQNVDTLSLMGNSYGIQFFTELIPFIEKIQSIRKVLFNDIFTTRTDEIVPSLKLISKMLENKGVVLFNLSDNAICPDGCLELENFFQYNQGLQYLFLNHSALSQAGTKSICSFLMSSNIQLKVFQAIKNRMDIQAEKLAEFLETQKELEELVIYQNNISDDVAQKIIKALNNTNIKWLDISDNFLKHQSMHELVQLLHNKDLNILKISDCNIGPDLTAVLMAWGERKDEILIEEFAFNYNEINDHEEFVVFLQKFKNLKKLSIKELVQEEDRDFVIEKLPDIEIEFESDYDMDEDLNEYQQNKIMQLMNEIKELKI